ncbi:MOSC domain-containing protein [Pseudalkalibacillus decolorationis]|uniref:MOSC domain-containing protein n=1 Tax=Pseudalkalibacillus decolorationis TaxID=163879 RepID=UPI00214744BC|nr:MOSC domain-containing protein [Pseudalkalibacillus decolorationis]
MTAQSIKVRSILVGKPKIIGETRNPVKSGIYKYNVSEKVYLSKVNFDGDEQADLKNHGGPDKAICVYSSEHYPYWESILQQQMMDGAFGENLTLEGITETDIYIGDRFQLGEAIVEVSQPRRPCFKLGIKWNEPKLAQYVQDTGYSGFYLRVEKEGWVTPGDPLIKTYEHPSKFSISTMNHIVYHDPDNETALERLIQLKPLASSWRKGIIKRLEKIRKAEAP